MLRIHKTRTTPYHPQSNGLVERTNRTVMTILRVFIERHQLDRWDEILPQCLLAYRTTVHPSTGPKPTLGAAHKFHRPWLGPSVIVHVRSPTVYVIRDTTNPTADLLTVLYRKLRPAQTPEEAQMRPMTVPPGSVPIAEQTVEIPAEGGCSNICGTEALGSVTHLRITRRVPHDMNVPRTVTFDSPWTYLFGTIKNVLLLDFDSVLSLALCGSPPRLCIANTLVVFVL
ncbi:uncharacterized protein DEA37_0008945 [Paragonimus westermani]|uniref:Integrase catalytic domain-containing protein n=1 Tax=Paragonimus westermani TaxID=34504 RepID=A0A5J4NF45_9TREM|nr:uncharacterized protein DEA37_0008945 [Paragonimus westermani]